MGQTVSFQEILRRLSIVDEDFVADEAGLEIGLRSLESLDPKTAALVRVSALAAIGSPEVCLEWVTAQAMAVGATENEVTAVLLAIAPVIGLGRIVGATHGVAGGFGYDIESALEGSPDV